MKDGSLSESAESASSVVNRNEDGAPNMFKVTLRGIPNLSPELAEEAQLRYREALILTLGSEVEVVAAWLAHQQAIAGHPAETPAVGETADLKAAVSRWWRADRAAETAAFDAWRTHPRQAFFEVSV